jgi:hypothetical protein
MGSNLLVKHKASPKMGVSNVHHFLKFEMLNLANRVGGRNLLPSFLTRIHWFPIFGRKKNINLDRIYRNIRASFLRHFPEERGETQSRPSGGKNINCIAFF